MRMMMTMMMIMRTTTAMMMMIMRTMTMMLMMMMTTMMMICRHYSGDHSECAKERPCRQGGNYESSKLPLDRLGAKMLESAIKNSVLFKKAPFFTNGLNTSELEGFFNILNMYRDKRIFFGSDTYRMRVLLSICYYNENKGRDVTSTWERTRSTDGRVMDRRRHFVDPRFDFADAIWLRFLCTE